MLSEFLNQQYQLTNGQQELVGLLDEFLINNDANCFLLKGYAGTGKTFLMKGLTEYLDSINRNFRISAPTGRAAKIISQKTKRKAYTIHKSIYSNTDIKEYEIVENEEGGETFKYFYDLRNNEDALNTIYIVDESSMISNDYSSKDDFFRFGSGYLLSDLINFVNSFNFEYRKIIFIGDDAQLPPYSSESSPALDANYISKEFQLKVREYELTEVVRQSENSGILKNATELRNSIKNKNYSKIKIDMQYEDTIETKFQQLENKYFSVCTSSKTDNTIIIAYSNKLVKEYNDFVRQYFFPNQKYITKDDKVIVVANNYNQSIEVLNGDFGIIKEVSDSPCSRNIPLKEKDKNGKVIQKNICLIFREVKIILKDVDNQEHILSCNIIENLLYSDERDLSYHETRALYVDFKIRHPWLKKRTPEFKIALREDKYFNALRIKFGYAVTCHKAQGGEWENTFVNFQTSQGKSNSTYFRWAYTALTRAKQKIFCINAPNQGIFSNLQASVQDQSTERNDLFILSKEVTEFEIPFDLVSKNSLLKNIFYAVWYIIKDEGINIDRINSSSYCENYNFSDSSNYSAVFYIWYKQNRQISTILLKSEQTEFAIKVNNLLQQLAKKFIIIEGEQEIDIIENELLFPSEKPFLKEFYDKQKQILDKHKILIESVKHGEYHEIYSYKKNGFDVVIKFNYNKKGIFGKHESLEKRVTSQELKTQIIDLLKSM
jgi:hypothetical protein